jgi:hypothetical protein
METERTTPWSQKKSSRDLADNEGRKAFREGGVKTYSPHRI